MVLDDPHVFLMCGRVVLKRQRPLTEAEYKHKERERLLSRLNAELAAYALQDETNRRANSTLVQMKSLNKSELMKGPLKLAATEY